LFNAKYDSHKVAINGNNPQGNYPQQLEKNR